jgi:hypothetical protein
MNNTNERSNERDQLTTRPDQPLPNVQDPQQHENPKDPKTVRQSEQGTDAAKIDYTA